MIEKLRSRSTLAVFTLAGLVTLLYTVGAPHTGG